MLILNEEKYAGRIYNGQVNDVKSTVGKIGYVTRYQLYTLGYDDQYNYARTVEWMKRNHANFDESTYSNLISDAVKQAHKRPFYNIDSIKITKQELEIVSSLNDLRAEKVLFVLLCMAKQQSVSSGFINGLVKYSLSELCKAAKISVPTDEREYILYNIIQHGFLGYPKKNNTQCLIVNFIDMDGDVVLDIGENGCKDVVYEYLSWKNNGHGYGRCEFCGRVIKQSKSNHKRFCKECSTVIGDISDDTKVISCADCGKLVYVSVLNTKTCRCEDCQSIENSASNRERQKRWYVRHTAT